MTSLHRGSLKKQDGPSLSVSKLTTSATFRRGNLPDTGVNLAYLATKEIKPSDIIVHNVASASNGNINNFIKGTYFGGWNGVLQGGPKITDLDIYVTDKFKDGNLSKPLFFVAKSRYWHEEWPIYVAGEEYNRSNVTLTEADGSTYQGNYIITVDPVGGYLDAEALPNGIDEQIPYRIVVYLDSLRSCRLVYNRVDNDMQNEHVGWTETLNPYPYFEEDTLTNVQMAHSDAAVYYPEQRGDEQNIYVPGELIQDNRRFQYFYWRIKGQLGRAVPPPATVNPTPDESPTLPTVSDPLDSTSPCYREPEIQPDSWSDFTPPIINIGIYNEGQGYPATDQTFLWFLESSPINRLKAKFLNPTRSDHSLAARTSSGYWEIKSSDIDTQEKINAYDIIIVPVVQGLFPYNYALDSWSIQQGKGLIFMFDHTGYTLDPPNLDGRWGMQWDTSKVVDMSTTDVTDHDMCTGLRGIHQLTESPCVPYSAYQWMEGSAIQCFHPDYYSSLVDGLTDDEETCSIAGIYDNRVAFLDPFSVISIMGIPRVVGHELVNNTHARHNWQEFYGLESTTEITADYIIRMTHMFHALRFFYNLITYLSYKGVVDIVGDSDITRNIFTSPTAPPKDLPPTPTESSPPAEMTWVEYNTPPVRDWVTTYESLSQSEIEADPTILAGDGRIFKRLFQGSPRNILQSYIADSSGIDYCTWGDSRAEVEVIGNPNVTIAQFGDTYYAYTGESGGKPFTAGYGYPEGWIRSDEWTSRKNLAGEDVEVDLFTATKREVKETYVDQELQLVTKTGIRKVPVESVYPVHSATWNVEVVDAGAPQTVYWTATGKKQGINVPTEANKIDSTVTFTVKSKTLQASRNTAYAWTYIPNCDALVKQGHSGDYVRYYQDALKKLGYFSGTPTGYFGSVTYNAVKHFQTDHNEILLDGIIGPETGGRINDACSDTGIHLYHWENYGDINNLLESNVGSYGRRTNQYGSCYHTTSLQDYITIDFATVQEISRIELQGHSGPPKNAGIPFKVTQISAWQGTTLVVDQRPAKLVYPNQTVQFNFGKSYTGISRIRIYVQTTTAFTSSATSHAFYWGMHWIKAFGPGTPSTGAITDVTKTGYVNLLPGASRTVSLPTTDPDGTAYTWNDASMTVTGSATAVSSGSPHTDWVISDTRSTANGDDGATDSTTITAKDGIKSFTAKLPSTYNNTQVAVLESVADGNTVVAFHDGTKFVGDKISVSFLMGTNPYVIGVQVQEYIPPSYRDEEYIYKDWDLVDVLKERLVVKDVSASSGFIEFIGQDPPPAFYAYKPYAVLQHNGRSNVRLYQPASELTSVDAWYPRISYGDFTVDVDISKSAYDWQASCTATNVQAVYVVPEPFSWPASGRFTFELIEEPLQYVGPTQIRTKKSPLLFNEAQDGRTTLTIKVNGSTLSDDDIEDICQDGLITLASSIDSSDTVLGTYTYRCTYSDVQGLNLNPYPGHPLTVDGRDYITYQKIGLPVYIYMLPAYCRSQDIIIADSVEDDVVRFTTNSRIFDQSSTYYNPLAVLIGVVSCTTNVTPSDITLLDARKRGGGSVDTATGEYFDIDYFTEYAYPEHGIVIFDISRGARDQEDLIRKAIENNIAAGTVYRIRWIGDTAIGIPPTIELTPSFNEVTVTTVDMDTTTISLSVEFNEVYVTAEVPTMVGHYEYIEPYNNPFWSLIWGAGTHYGISSNGQVIAFYDVLGDQSKVIYISQDSGYSYSVATWPWDGYADNNIPQIKVSGDGAVIVARMEISGGIGSLVKSTDYGSSWTTITPSNLTTLWGGKLFINSDGSVIICNENNNDNLCISLNGGTSWTQTTGAGEYYNTSFMASDDGQTIICINSNVTTLRRSTNAGSSWSDLSYSGTMGSFPYCDGDSDLSTMLILGENQRVWVSTDSGATWNESFPIGTGNRVYKAPQVSANGDRMCLVDTTSTPDKFFYSKDSGLTWDELAPPVVGTYYPDSGVILESGSWELVICDADDGLFYTRQAWPYILVPRVSPAVTFNTVTVTTA